jgi:hypothetical protein
MAKRVYIETTIPIVHEVREIKERLAQAFDFDIDRILADAREKQQKCNRKVLAPPIVRKR